MIKRDARSADRLARAAHRDRARTAWKMCESAGPCGGEIPGYRQARVVRSRNTGPCEGQIIEIVGPCATKNGAGASESDQTGAAGIGAIVGPIPSNRVREGASV